MANENGLYDTAGCPHPLSDQTNHTKYKTAQSPELSISGIRPKKSNEI